MEKKSKRMSRNRYNLLLLTVFTLILFLIALNRLGGNRIEVEIGGIAPTTIVANRELEDKIGTEKLRQSMEENVKPQYNIDPSVELKIKSDIKEFLELVVNTKAEEIEQEEKIQRIMKDESYDFSEEDVALLLNFTPESIEKMQNNIFEILEEGMKDGVKLEEVESKKDELSIAIDDYKMTKNMKNISKKLVLPKIRVNNLYNEEETERKKLEAKDSVKPVLLKEGELIVYKGEKIGDRQYQILQDMGMLKEQEGFSYFVYGGTLILLFLAMLMIGQYVYNFNLNILNNTRFLTILIVDLLTILVSLAISNISPLLMPISMVGLLVLLMVDSKLAIIINLFTVLYISFLLKLDLTFTSLFIVSGTFGVLVRIKQEQRYNILLNGLMIGFVNIIFVLAISAARETRVIGSPMEILYLMINGIIAGVLVLGTLPIWENVFKVLTSLKLLELSNPNQPFLKKLMMEAPGTYHHSILVGNLAEAAAESIGCNALLARVASYYHDLGKTVRPKYFAENQMGINNPHDKLLPTESFKVISAHPKDGVAMGREGNLPKEITDIMEEHHGNTAVAYFYYKEKEMNPNTKLTVDDFRYDGRIPQSKESVIIMLADSSEAAVRSLKEIDREKIEDMVRKVVKGKIDDNQLNQCDITYREVELVIQSFVNTLVGIHHDRIEYPDTKNKELE